MVEMGAESVVDLELDSGMASGNAQLMAKHMNGVLGLGTQSSTTTQASQSNQPASEQAQCPVRFPQFQRQNAFIFPVSAGVQKVMSAHGPGMAAEVVPPVSWMILFEIFQLRLRSRNPRSRTLPGLSLKVYPIPRTWMLVWTPLQILM